MEKNAWEYYPGNGREFLREFYGRVSGRSGFPRVDRERSHRRRRRLSERKTIFPASWINANFDVWIGHAEDVQAWDLLWDAREAYARAEDAKAQRIARTHRTTMRLKTPRNRCSPRKAAIGAGGTGQNTAPRMMLN